MRIIFKGDDYLANGFPLIASIVAVKGTFIGRGVAFTQNASRGMIVINAQDATIPFQSGANYSVIEIPPGVSNITFNSNVKHAIAITALSEGTKTLLYDSGFVTANTLCDVDISQYQNVFYCCLSLDNITNVDVQNITWELVFE